ncbi:MAG: MFS transporter [Anaerolineae bacterium]|nr:MFS transporter [Anaerolineae bacterium]
MNALQRYFQNIRRFSRGVRLYLLVTLLQGIGWGIFQLFFNFYILSLGYQRDFLGFLISIPPLTALVVGVFAGYLSDLIGRKRAFILGGVISVLAQIIMLSSPSTGILIASSALRGMGMSIFSIAAAPFLMEQSSEQERIHLFSFNSGVMTMSIFLGNFVGGSLPLLVAGQLDVAPTSSAAYTGTLAVTTLLNFLALVPLLFLERDQSDDHQQTTPPFKAVWEHRQLLTRLLLPSLIISLGAGMLIPFLNVFFRYRYQLPDDLIGSISGFGSLGMGIAIFLGPLLAEKWGKAKTVVITQGLSVPFLIILGFVSSLPLAILAFFMRASLMNLSGPVYQTMVMEKSDAETRSMTASFYSMIWNFGRALTPSISGPLQEAYGFNPVFLITIVAYGLSVYLVYRWFVQSRPATVEFT